MAACGVRPFSNVYRSDSYELSSLLKSNMIMVRMYIVNEDEYAVATISKIYLPDYVCQDMKKAIIVGIKNRNLSVTEYSV